MKRSTVIAWSSAVGAPLLVAFLSWLASLVFPQDANGIAALFLAIWSGIVFAWHWLWADVTTSRVVFWFLVVVVIVLTGLLIVVRSLVSGQVAQEAETGVPLGLSDDAVQILRLLNTVDGNPLRLSILVGELGVSRIRVEHAAEVLDGKHLIYWYRDGQGDLEAALTPSGRAFCVKHFTRAESLR